VSETNRLYRLTRGVFRNFCVPLGLGGSRSSDDFLTSLDVESRFFLLFSFFFLPLFFLFFFSSFFFLSSSFLDRGRKRISPSPLRGRVINFPASRSRFSLLFFSSSLFSFSSSLFRENYAVQKGEPCEREREREREREKEALKNCSRRIVRMDRARARLSSDESSAGFVKFILSARKTFTAIR